MTPDQVRDALTQAERGIQNGAEIKRIVAVGSGNTYRDIELPLDAENSALILQAIIYLLQTKFSK